MEEQLAKENQDLIETWISIWLSKSKMVGSDSRIDDLRSAGFMGLLNAIRSYEEGTASFRTFASRCIKNAMLDEFKHMNVRDKYIVLFDAVDLDSDEEERTRQDHYKYKVLESPTMEDTTTPEEELVAKEDLREAYNTLIEILGGATERQEYIIRMRVLAEDAEKLTQAEIAKKFGCNQSTIQRDERKIYDSLRKTN